MKPLEHPHFEEELQIENPIDRWYSHFVDQFTHWNRKENAFLDDSTNILTYVLDDLYDLLIFAF